MTFIALKPNLKPITPIEGLKVGMSVIFDITVLP